MPRTATAVLPVTGAVILVAAAVAGAVLLARRRRHARTAPQATPRPPWTRSEMISVASLLAGTTLTVVGLLLQGGGGGGKDHHRRDVDAPYLANLIRQGQFTERLPSPFEAGAIRDARIADPSAADRVDAVELTVKTPPDQPAFASIEVYPSIEQAEKRAHDARIGYAQRYGAPNVGGTDRSFCIAITNSPQGAWTCGASHLYAYAEATVTPGANVYRSRAVDTVAALLRYTDRQTRIAERAGG